jgi:hypothetical protein
MMRLPPPDEGPPPPPPGGGAIVAPPPAPDPGIAFRVEAGAAGRVGPGSDAGFGGRLLLGAMIQPSTAHAWRFGLRGDLGTSSSIDRGGTTGTWSDWNVLAVASWTYGRAPWEIEPWVGAGVTRSVLDVSDSTTSTSRHDAQTLFSARVGTMLRRRFGSLTAGLDLELSLVPGAPVYTKSTMGMGAPTVFEAPRFSIVFGIVVAVDLGG